MVLIALFVGFIAGMAVTVIAAFTAMFLSGYWPGKP